MRISLFMAILPPIIFQILTSAHIFYLILSMTIFYENGNLLDIQIFIKYFQWSWSNSLINIFLSNLSCLLSSRCLILIFLKSQIIYLSYCLYGTILHCKLQVFTCPNPTNINGNLWDEFSLKSLLLTSIFRLFLLIRCYFQ